MKKDIKERYQKDNLNENINSNEEQKWNIYFQKK